MQKLLLALILFCIAPSGAFAQRTVLSGPMTFYVAPAIPVANSYWGAGGPLVTTGGDDATGNGTQAAPWATPQHAHDVLFNSYDLACQPVTIQLAVAPAGQYNFYDKGWDASGKILGQCGVFPQLVVGGGKPDFIIGKYGPLILLGDKTNPTGAFIYPPVGGGSIVSLSDGAALKVVGIGADTSLSQQDIFQAFSGSLLVVGNVSLGNAGYPGNTWSNDFSVGMGAGLIISGDYLKNGSSSNHMQIGGGSWVYFDNNGDPALPIKVTFNAGVNWNGTNGNCTIISDMGWVFAVGVKWLAPNGSPATVIGHPVCLFRNGVVETNGPKDVPGTLGSTSDGAPGNFYH